MNNKQVALIAAALLTGDRGVVTASSVAYTKDLAEQLESWLNDRP